MSSSLLLPCLLLGVSRIACPSPLASDVESLPCSVQAEQDTQGDASDPSEERARVIQRARGLLRQRRAGDAAKLLAQWVEKHAKDGEAQYLYGSALHAAGKLDEALVQHERAASFEAYRGRALYNVARVLAKKGDDERAFEKLREARESGFENRARMVADAEFASLRDHAEFEKVLPVLRRGKDLFVEEVRILHDILGESTGDQFGWVARRIGDVDGDGVVDFMTSAPTKAIGTKKAAGRAYVYSSKGGTLLWTFDGRTSGARLGSGLAGCGDLDGDGTPDAIVGAPGAARAYALSGTDGEILFELAGESGKAFGTKGCGLEDIDGDGRPEVCIGEPGADRVHIYGADGKAHFVIDAPESARGGGFGTALDGYLAVTCGLERTKSSGDGAAAPLLVVGAPRAGGTGRAFVYRVGRSSAELAFEIRGDSTSRNLGQYFVAILRDSDGDGIEDVYASDWLNAAAAPGAGRIYVHSGKTGKRVLTLTGEQAGEGFGTSMSQAGDVNRDGISDLIVGAWQNRAGAPSGGRCTLFSGKDGKVLATYTCRQAGDTFGFDAQGIGDVDGDGVIDFLCTSAWSPVVGPQTGRVVVVAGPRLD